MIDRTKQKYKGEKRQVKSLINFLRVQFLGSKGETRGIALDLPRVIKAFLRTLTLLKRTTKFKDKNRFFVKKMNLVETI